MSPGGGGLLHFLSWRRAAAAAAAAPLSPLKQPVTAIHGLPPPCYRSTHSATICRRRLSRTPGAGGDFI